MLFNVFYRTFVYITHKDDEMNTQTTTEKQLKRLQLQLVLKALDITYKPIAERCGCTVPQVGHILNNRRSDNHNVIAAAADLIKERVLEAA